jgi:hypothetical protein
MAELNIWDNDTRVGKVLFDEHPQYLSYARTAASFNLRIPAEILLRSAPENEPLVFLNNLRLTFSLKSSSQPDFELGRLHHDSSYTSYVSKNPSGRPMQFDPVGR